MADRSFLSWPFLEARHPDLYDRVEAWARPILGSCTAKMRSSVAAAATVRRSSRELGNRAAGDRHRRREGTFHGPLDARSLCICREVLARHGGLADFAFAMQGLGTGPIGLFGRTSRRALAAGRRAGQAISAFALSEAAAGSDVSALAMSATRDGNGWRLDGEKTWISNAGIADLYVVFARTGEAPGAKGLSAFVVEGDAGILRPQDNRSHRATPDRRARLRRCESDGGRTARRVRARVPHRHGHAGRIPLDRRRRRSRLRPPRTGRGVEACHPRKLFGQPLSDLQLTRAKLADMALAIDAAALLIYRAAWTKDVKGARVSRESTMAKLFATEEAQKVIDSAVQIFGGLGVTHGHIAEKLYREIRALRIYEGASEVQKLVIATRVLAEFQA